MRRLLLLTWLAAACGGTVAGGDGGAQPLDDSGCPKPPRVPVYACEAGPPDAQGCGPWDPTQPAASYPSGCVVTTTEPSTYCGPVTCTCYVEPDGGGAWGCPL